jgi:outer membrane protein assembly factor BamB
LLLAMALCWLPTALADWPQFRGPGGQGHADAHDLPATWSETENIVWKVPVPGLGHSSPTIAGEQIWVTTAVEAGLALHAVCLARSSGKLVHDVPLFRRDEVPESHGKNSQASPTAVLDDEHVYAHFGASGTACVERKTGRVVWTNATLEYSQPYAAASSPVLYKDFVILNCDGTDHQFVVALDKRSGQVVWKTQRAHLEESRNHPDPRWPGGRMLMAYSTPLVIEIDGLPQLVSPAADHVAAYDTRTGKEIWWLAYKGFSEVGRPVFAQGILIVPGFEEVAERTLFAIRAGGRGDVSKSHLLWKRKKSVPHVPSPLVVGDELYLVTDSGVGTCLDLKSGKEHWQARIGGNVSASPMYADGKIYVCNEEGETTVLTPGRTYQVVGKNTIDGHILASPAAAGRALFLRSETHVYRVEIPGDGAPTGR